MNNRENIKGITQFVFSRKTLVSFVLLILIFLFTLDSNAQCAMCKASAEQSVDGGSTKAAWINRGIFFMLIIPYTLFGLIFWRWYRWYKAEQKAS